MESLRLNAMAKINLGLDVLRRREDGYHEVKMVMQTVGICDELEFTKLTEDCIRISTDKEELPSDGNNLIYRAAKLMKDTYGIREGVAVKLQKNIPIAAGMAGGSTDAAATIHGMDRIFGLGLSLEEKQRLGVKIGADVPYCLMGGTALSEGIGEVLTALPQAPDAFLVVAKPDINVSTKFVYENLHADRLTYHPDIDGMVESIRNGDLKGITDRMGNVLETVTIKRYPVIAEMKAFLLRQGAMNALMSGSGPTVFGVFDKEEDARRAYTAMVEQGNFTKQVFLTKLI
ncbi:MAG: 4-(cytidine 5'-diphospho)-2-C-methyl-D-erythritol kinase [Eubacteriales bacterium]|nr:4-(cytidine 5'-diphospho)-2-C-methyl-D-erythritol kinase [Eubacteriales bacterium]